MVNVNKHIGKDVIEMFDRTHFTQLNLVEFLFIPLRDRYTHLNLFKVYISKG